MQEQFVKYIKSEKHDTFFAIFLGFMRDGMSIRIVKKSMEVRKKMGMEREGKKGQDLKQEKQNERMIARRSQPSLNKV